MTRRGAGRVALNSGGTWRVKGRAATSALCAALSFGVDVEDVVLGRGERSDFDVEPDPPHAPMATVKARIKAARRIGRVEVLWLRNMAPISAAKSRDGTDMSAVARYRRDGALRNCYRVMVAVRAPSATGADPFASLVVGSAAAGALEGVLAGERCFFRPKAAMAPAPPSSSAPMIQTRTRGFCDWSDNCAARR